MSNRRPPGPSEPAADQERTRVDARTIPDDDETPLSGPPGGLTPDPDPFGLAVPSLEEAADTTQQAFGRPSDVNVVGLKPLPAAPPPSTMPLVRAGLRVRERQQAARPPGEQAPPIESADSELPTLPPGVERTPQTAAAVQEAPDTLPPQAAASKPAPPRPEKKARPAGPNGFDRSAYAVRVPPGLVIGASAFVLVLTIAFLVARNRPASGVDANGHPLNGRELARLNAAAGARLKIDPSMSGLPESWGLARTPGALVPRPKPAPSFRGRPAGPRRTRLNWAPSERKPTEKRSYDTGEAAQPAGGGPNLIVFSDPPGAFVSVDGKVWGTTPLFTPAEDDWKTIRVRVFGPAVLEQERPVSPNKEGHFEANFKLKPNEKFPPLKQPTASSKLDKAKK